MKTPAVLFVFSCILCAIVSEKYTTKYDNFDIKQLLKNDRLMGSYVKCLLGKGRCSNGGLELKRSLPEALTSDCAKCSVGQKHASKIIIDYLINNQKAWWNQLEAKYDPSGAYRKKYMTKF